MLFILQHAPVDLKPLVPPETKDKREVVHAATRMEKFMRNHAPITNVDTKPLINSERD